eukprot:COSAG04_NODE_993_length_8879_cov_12.972665_3_plen_301_part_00
MHRSPIPKLQGPPLKKGPKFFRASRESPDHTTCTEPTRPTSRRHRRAQRALVAALSAAGGPGAEPPVLGKFGHFAHFLHPKSAACGHERPKATLGVTERFVHPIAPPSLLAGWRASSSTNCHHLTAAGRSRQPERQWQGQGAGREGGGQWKPGTGGDIGDAPCPRPGAGPPPSTALLWSSLGERVGRTGGGGVGIGGGWQGSRIKLAGLHNTLKPPLRLAGADAFPDGRRARPAARQQVRIRRGGCGGRQPPAIRAAPQAKFWKITKKCQRKFVFFSRFCLIKNASNFSAARPVCPQGTH